ncbi:MAG: MFS transporter [Clostridiales bacterium]|nr:MFS transporter [Clostridiales bacterium]
MPKIYWTLSSVAFLFYFAWATSAYLTVFLQKSGFSTAQVGVINGINFAVSICATPFWGVIADKVRSNRKIIVFCMGVASILWALVPASSRIVLGPIFLLHLLIPLCSFFRLPAQSLMDAFNVQTCAREGVAYGSVRIWGSISFAIMSLSLSAILPWTGVEASFYMYGIAFIPLLLILSRMKDTTDAGAPRKSLSFREMQFGRLFKNYYFLTYMVFAIFMHMPVNTSMTFLPYLVDMVGGDTAQFGLISGYKALLEVPTLLLMAPMRKRFPLPVAVILAGTLFTIEFSLYAGANSLLQILAIQTIHGLGGGLMIGASTNYVYTMAPDGLNSTAHTLNGAMNSIAAIIGNMLGGVLITFIGIRRFYSMASLIVACAIVYFISTLLIGSKILHKPIPRSK